MSVYAIGGVRPIRELDNRPKSVNRRKGLTLRVDATVGEWVLLYFIVYHLWCLLMVDCCIVLYWFVLY